MKPNIHPKTYEISVKCACGNVMEILTTLPELSVEICAACHPFFTGKEKLIDTEGRIDRFNKKYEQAKAALEKQKSEQKQPRLVVKS